MSTEANMALIRHAWERLNAQDMSVFTQAIAPGFVLHRPELEPTPEQIFTAFPDIHYTVEDLLAVDDTVILRYSFQATHQGDIYGMAPTGKRVTITGIEIDRFVDGKLVEAWNEWDVAGLLQQLGAIPALSPA